ncbi:glutamate dehydrogenase (NAD) [Kushneria avicenniae]|uniref:Glutamate dehydrogenase (NAD) n=1 Tax=Kushneria avicenniae TaxID=402385 RepID=A0A1I1IHM1_9GAMM|nr:NAD-glutamate dehydrogenase [Kushneria avicenniae]SFC35747.1 glutamate dehydrogenase (NAD) [Kushneria avicenniae]
MQSTVPDNKEDFFKALEALLDERLAPEQARNISAFARHYYAGASHEDLRERHFEDLYGATLSTWFFLQQRERDGRPKVRVFNPEYEEHGWQSTHTVVEVVSSDMSFLVDSVRIELNRLGFTVHAILNTVIATERDDQQRLVRLAPPRDTEAPAGRESIIYIEIDRHSDPTMLDELRNNILDVLTDVRSAVSDFDAMRDQAKAALEEMNTHHPRVVEERDIDEARDFLSWLLDDHFTFLGFEEYVLETRDGHSQLVRAEGSELGVLTLDRERYNEEPHQFNDSDAEQGEYVLIPELISFAKSAWPSRIHRPSYPDYIIVERHNEQGDVIGERHFLGLYTLSVYNERPVNIPVLRRKIDAVLNASGIDPKGHNAKQLQQILEVYPRDELFQMSTDDLCRTAMGIFSIRERRRVRLFIREDRSGRFYSCLVYVPRDVFSTDLRLRIQNMLCEELDASFGDFNTYLSESVLARIQLILRFNNDRPVAYDNRALEKKVIAIARGWRDDLHEALVEGYGEEPANRLMERYRDAFPSSYREDFTPRTAIYDIGHMEGLDDCASIGLSLYRQLEHESDVNLKLFHRDDPVPLSDVLPMLEHMGLRVISERPYEIERADNAFWIHDFNLETSGREPVDLHGMRHNFIDAFTRIWSGAAESDSFNRLIISARLDWREVAMLRAYARYLKQVRFGLSQDYIATALTQHAGITRELVTLFRGRFDPQDQLDDTALAKVRERIEGYLEEVTSLNDDQLIRRYMELIDATLRTNYFQPTADGGPKSYISFKLATRRISDVPRPRPLYEIFVYSPRMEGVHLRTSNISRGGMRWSDRFEDFRTEILGLVKAQHVKNSVIVPSGAKGGFICKQPPIGGSREEIQKEGIACYQTLIRGMLDITDNLVDKQVVPPEHVVRHDEDDPYLVVAADKGTATFSDIANALAREYNFWLGDAFASGGKNGYDHKAMAITARGAWEAVKRHFRELGVNTQEDPFTVLGVGDMAGDVFGNGMLLSEKIQLVAAFNHRHIFIDPEPDCAASFQERKRLFGLATSSWEDYDTSLISEGGGVFSRDAKSIEITEAMKSRFGITASRLSPVELIHALLKAKVDLFWNGGIGTYVKSSEESHADVGDKSNDTLRVNGSELGCRVVGEGGNLGVTQLGRREAAQHGVRLNTDFIDNAGGVNCSDHEVNIKILLDEVVERGDMTNKQRSDLLAQMTDEVADLVVGDNYRQTQALSLSRLLSTENLEPYRRFIRDLEETGQLDRELEALPDDGTLASRAERGEGLTHPELSSLISHAKIDLKSLLVESDVPSEPGIVDHAERAFPATLVERYGKEIANHRLRHQIVATKVAGDVINHMGISFVRRLMDITGTSAGEVVRAYVMARDSFGLEPLWQQIEELDSRVNTDIQYNMMLALVRLLRRATRYFLRYHMQSDARQVVRQYAPDLERLQANIGDRLRGESQRQCLALRDRYIEAGVPEALAERVAATENLYAGLGIIDTAQLTDVSLERVADTYYLIGEKLSLPWMLEQVNRLEVSDSWQTIARETLRDDLDRQQLTLTASVLRGEEYQEVDRCVEQWMSQHKSPVERWCALLEEVHSTDELGYALFTVAVRALGELAERPPSGV